MLKKKSNGGRILPKRKGCDACWETGKRNYFTWRLSETEPQYVLCGDCFRVATKHPQQIMEMIKFSGTMMEGILH